MNRLSAKIESSRPLRYGLALLSGLLWASLFPGWNLSWLAPVALVPLLLAVAREYHPWHRFGLGLASGIVFWALLCNWIAQVLAVHGGMGPWAGWGAFALFCLAKGSHVGLFSLFTGILFRHAYGVPAAAFLWILHERTQQPLHGFAWTMLGNAAVDSEFAMRVAPLFGVYGVSWLLALLNFSLAAILLGYPRHHAAAALFCLLPVALPPLPSRPPARHSIVAVQPNFAVDEEWTENAERAMRLRLEALSAAAARPGLPIVWPETPAPIFYGEDPDLRQAISQLATTHHAPLLFGTIGRTPSGRPLNSAQLVDSSGNPLSRYDKVFLVPFGEFVPSLFSWVNQVSSEVGAYSAGAAASTALLPPQPAQASQPPQPAHRWGVFICYESAVPHHVRSFVAQGAEVLFNLSNDGYFFRSAAREQHLLLVRLRAIENRRWVLRVTNNGHTAAIDPAGQLRQLLPSFTAMAAPLHFDYESSSTPYSLHGDWFVWLGGALLLIALWVSQLPHYDPTLDRPPSPAPRP